VHGGAASSVPEATHARNSDVQERLERDGNRLADLYLLRNDPGRAAGWPHCELLGSNFRHHDSIRAHKSHL
jgi:hypothetical protein